MERELTYKKEKYICPLCDTEYEYEDAALACWELHYGTSDLELSPINYAPNHPFPNVIKLIAADGSECYYAKTKNCGRL